MKISSLLAKSPLVDRTILVTRPNGREKHLVSMIKRAGGSAIHYPAITIQPPRELEIKELIRLREQLQGFDMAIFISATAVEHSLMYFPVLPEHFTVVSIGSKTSAALHKQNIPVDIEAPGNDTESLLNLPQFQMPYMDGKRILIFRGVGGRPLLGDTLVRRGAQVRYVETYRRTLPPQQPLSSEQVDDLDAITISSNDGLDNLVTLMEDPSILIDIPLFVPSTRVVRQARQHGFKIIEQANSATDEDMIAALSDYFTRGYADSEKTI